VRGSISQFHAYLTITDSAIAIALASWTRIYTFLVASESVSVSDAKHPIYSDPIRIVGGSFQWAKKDAPKADEKTTTFIHDINLSIKKGSLTAIVGNVGSGKSSILSAMLGEMECVSGTVRSHTTKVFPRCSHES
jgi:ATP-binding cassette subfamily C (CFTR/MRP) protein 1